VADLAVPATARRRRAVRLSADRRALLVVPAAAFLAVFFLLPLLDMSARSVTEPADAGLSNFTRFFEQESYVRILTNTFWISILTTAACLLIGFPFAYLMTVVQGRVAGLLLIAVLLPFWSSVLVRTFAWQVILRDTGIINTFLMDLGIIAKPLPLIRTTTGVIIGMTYVLLPFMVLPIWAVLRRIDPEFGRAAASLGAPPITAFRRIVLPLALPGVLAGSLLVFVLALGFYITPALLGGPRDQMISQLIVEQVERQLDWGFAAAMSLLLLAATFTILFVASRFVRLQDMFGSSVEE
jgi:ABC-type spermidine/putrescine transport system permease subunit I